TILPDRPHRYDTNGTNPPNVTRSFSKNPNVRKRQDMSKAFVDAKKPVPKVCTRAFYMKKRIVLKATKTMSEAFVRFKKPVPKVCTRAFYMKKSIVLKATKTMSEAFVRFKKPVLKVCTRAFYMQKSIVLKATKTMSEAFIRFKKPVPKVRTRAFYMKKRIVLKAMKINKRKHEAANRILVPQLVTKTENALVDNSMDVDKKDDDQKLPQSSSLGTTKSQEAGTSTITTVSSFTSSDKIEKPVTSILGKDISNQIARPSTPCPKGPSVVEPTTPKGRVGGQLVCPGAPRANKVYQYTPFRYLTFEEELR
ncbi:hypothetical protein FN846DRAFT_984659, partial [Sphaerosporella brunnea]